MSITGERTVSTDYFVIRPTKDIRLLHRFWNKRDQKGVLRTLEDHVLELNLVVCVDNIKSHIKSKCQSALSYIIPWRYK